MTGNILYKWQMQSHLSGWELLQREGPGEGQPTEVTGWSLERDGSRQLQGGDPTMAMAGPCEAQYLNERAGEEGEDGDIEAPRNHWGGPVLS